MEHNILCLKDIELCTPIVNARVVICTGISEHSFVSDSEGLINLGSNAEFETLNEPKDFKISLIDYSSKNVCSTKLFGDIFFIKRQPIFYLSTLKVALGEKLLIFVHSEFEYKIRVYLHGLDKNIVKEIASCKKSIQLINDPALVEFGLNWSPTTELSIDEQYKPGLYSIEVIDAQGQTFSSPFIVESKINKSKMLLAVNDTTWTAYNVWGGRSKYRNFILAGDAKVGLKRKLFGLFKKISINFYLKQYIIMLIHRFFWGRIIIPSEWENLPLSNLRPLSCCSMSDDTPFIPFNNHLAPLEWRMIAWLERCGFQFDIVACSTLESKSLNGYKVIIFSGHAEYWSKQMYKNVLNSHKKHSLWIINSSGNTMNREIEIGDSSIRYIGEFADGVECESKLFGVKTTLSGYGTAAPFKIKSDDSWVFEGINTNYRDNKFGVSSLLQNPLDETKPYRPEACRFYSQESTGASGWETDKRTKFTDSNFKLIAKGMNRFGGGAQMLIKPPTGSIGGVFTVSSINFSSSLLVDNRCSKIMFNVLTKSMK